MTRILVTGGSGFIGSHLVNRLLKEKYPVKVFDIMERSTHLPKDVEYIQGSLLDKNAIRKAVNYCDTVFHLGADLGVKKTDEDPLTCLNINIEGTINLLDACELENVRHIIFSSSSEVYGEQILFPISETNPVSPKSVYGVTKLAGEEYLKAYAKQYSTSYNIVRFFNIYGPGQRPDFVMSRFINNCIRSKPPTVYGKGDQVRAFCYVDDAVKGLIKVMNGDYRTTNDTFNIGNDTEPMSIDALAREIIKLTGSKVKPEYVEMEDSDRTERREIQKRYPDITKARKLLGYDPKVSLDEGLKKTIEWWREK